MIRQSDQNCLKIGTYSYLFFIKIITPVPFLYVGFEWTALTFLFLALWIISPIFLRSFSSSRPTSLLCWVSVRTRMSFSSSLNEFMISFFFCWSLDPLTFRVAILKFVKLIFCVISSQLLEVLIFSRFTLLSKFNWHSAYAALWAALY